MKLWGGRFRDEPDSLAAQFNNSLTFDWRLADVDVQGSIAWAKGLCKASVLTEIETDEIVSGLQAVLAEIQSDSFQPQLSDEDVHTAVERRLTELIGPVAGKLHTGRSRNDQVATDFRLWMLSAITIVDHHLTALQESFIQRAQSDLGIIIPAYTHLQRAQPVLLSHWWLAHFWPLAADRQRLAQLRQRVAVLPLGSSALAGTPYPVDRQFLADLLGFSTVSPNSLAAVADRDFAAEFLFITALIGIHLSRLAETLIIYSTAEFGFIELADAYSTGSSLMPQKKNPDVLELTRGKSGALIGKLTGLLATLKSLPSAYDKDLQEDKLPVFEASDTVNLMLPVLRGCIMTLDVKAEKIAAALDPAMLATDLADYLVKRGLPFRQAHQVIGQLVRRAAELQIPIHQLPLNEFQSASPIFQLDVYEVFEFSFAINQRQVIGGTAMEAVKDQIQQAITIMTAASIP